MTEYESIYDRFARKITDFVILDLSDDDVADLLLSYLSSAIAKFRTCESDLSKRDDNAEAFEIDLADIEIEILALMMVEEWCEPQLNSSLLTQQIVGGSTEKFYAQANQLEKVQELATRNRIRSQKAHRDYITERFRRKQTLS